MLIGSDLPELSIENLGKALESLDRNDMTIGPAGDGGYWSIGFSKKLIYPLTSWPFTGIPWGTSAVFDETLKKAKIEKISTSILPINKDIDYLSDLERW